MTTRRLFLAKLAGLAGFTLLSKAKGDYTKPLSLPVVVPPFGPNREGMMWAAAQRVVDYDRLLYCISAVETQHEDRAVGPCGARSRFQISEAVWKQYTAGSVLFSRFSTACKGATAHAVATGHIQWLERQLRIYAWTSPVWPIAWCWRGGLAAWENQTIRERPATYADYASRVTNLYNDPTYEHT